MKQAAIVLLFLIPGFLSIAPTTASNSVETPAAGASVSLSALPLDFIPNRGQAAPEARFFARTPGYTLWLAADGLVFDASAGGRRDVTRLSFFGASPDPAIISVEATRHVVNFITGSDPAQWRTGIGTSRAVLYKSLYEGIDLKVYGVEREIEYDWVVAPGADPDRIRFACNGHDSARIDADGNLAVGTALGDILHRKPVAFQVVDGRRSEVAARFEEREPGLFGFEIGAYDRRAALVIDPAVLLSSTYIGGSKNDYLESMAVDDAGAVFAAGFTESSNFPLKDALDATISGMTDAVVVKIAPGGKSLEFSTFMGGNGADTVSGIALDRDGRPVICGSTKSSNFPMMKAYDASLNGGADFFVARLDADGSKLLYSTYIGGSKDDYACGIRPNADGSLVVSGGSESANFPVKNAFNRKNSGNRDAVLLKLSKDGKSLAFSTYYGGSGDEWVEAQDVDAKGCPYIIGLTYSSNLPVKDAFQSAYRGNGDVFLAKFAPSGGALVYATYFGGPGLDDVGDISVSAKGAVTMAGHTDSNAFPLKNAWDTTRNGVADVFVAQFAPSGRGLVFSTYLGGNGYDYTSRVDVDAAGSVWLFGKTTSKDFPVQDAYNPGLSGGMDCFLARFAAGGQDLTFSTYLGGHDDDRSGDFVVGADGEVIIVGYTYSANFPVKNAYDQTWNGGSDGFVARLKVPSAAARR
jgi:hypothetical protein